MRYLILTAFLFIVTTTSAQVYRVMTYNIRFDNPADGINAWGNRKDKVSSLLEKYNPDIIGVQEALHHQLEDLIKARPAFTYVGAGRDDGKTAGEYSALLIRKDKFEILDQNTFWLSETPYVPGSKNWDAMITRVATWAKLKDLKTKRVFIVINTHFDHVGVEARKQSARIIKTHVARLPADVPVIVMGDLNCTRSEDPYQVLTANDERVLSDPAPQNPPGTFCNFGVNSMECRPIDYIFHTKQWNNKNYMVITDNDGKNYPSDHLPVMVTLSLNKPSKRSPKRD